MWKALSVIVFILSVMYFRKGRNAVWGGLTIGIIIGSIISVLKFFAGKGFDWHIVIKATTLGILIGFLAELLAKFRFGKN